MAHVEVSALEENEKSQLVCTYAALLLHDSGLDIDAEKLQKVIKATGNKTAAYWPKMFANAIANHDIKDMLSNIGMGGGAPAPPAAAAAPAAAAKKEEPEEEEADVDMGGLFGDDY